MEFRTTVRPLDCRGMLSHSSPVMLLGSCFSDNIGERMRRSLFPVMVNPFGTLYNPESIKMVLERFLTGSFIDERELVSNGRLYHCFLCHSSLSSTDPHKVVDVVNSRIESAGNFLRRVKAVIVTLGTAWVYRLASTGDVVANCHKFPSSHFTRSILTVDEATAALTDIVDMLAAVDKDIKVIFTVSPIRHLADGAHGNQLSKATLLLAVDNVCRRCESVMYFPSYEIMMDDLRDYRFYAADMVHPSDVAIDYIYDLFMQTYFSSGSVEAAMKCRRYWLRTQHRPLTDDTAGVEKFRMDTERMRADLTEQYPYLANVINLI